MTQSEFLHRALVNPFNPVLLERLAGLGLGECHLTAGCLFQAVWNERAGRAPGWGVKDYDIFYWDGGDLSWEAEDAVIRRVAAATADLPIVIEVKNQARVHLWYGERFGAGYPPLPSARAGIDRYLVACTCVGIEVESGAVYAPFGLDELAAGMLRINPLNARPDLFRDKAASYRERWPWLTIVA